MTSFLPIFARELSTNHEGPALGIILVKKWAHGVE
jgi:hypothetical protein